MSHPVYFFFLCVVGKFTSPCSVAEWRSEGGWDGSKALRSAAGRLGCAGVLWIMVLTQNYVFSGVT